MNGRLLISSAAGMLLIISTTFSAGLSGISLHMQARSSAVKNCAIARYAQQTALAKQRAATPRKFVSYATFTMSGLDLPETVTRYYYDEQFRLNRMVTSMMDIAIQVLTLTYNDNDNSVTEIMETLDPMQTDKITQREELTLYVSTNHSPLEKAGTGFVVLGYSLDALDPINQNNMLPDSIVARHYTWNDADNSLLIDEDEKVIYHYSPENVTTTTLTTDDLGVQDTSVIRYVTTYNQSGRPDTLKQYEQNSSGAFKLVSMVRYTYDTEGRLIEYSDSTLDPSVFDFLGNYDVTRLDYYDDGTPKTYTMISMDSEDTTNSVTMTMTFHYSDTPNGIVCQQVSRRSAGRVAAVRHADDIFITANEGTELQSVTLFDLGGRTVVHYRPVKSGQSCLIPVRNSNSVRLIKVQTDLGTEIIRLNAVPHVR